MAEIFSGDLTCGTSMGGLRCHAVQARAWRGQLEAVGCPALLKFLKSESTGFLNSMYGSFQDTIPCEIEPSSRHHVQCELLLESSASHQCVYGVGFLLLLFRFHGTLVMICRTLFFDNELRDLVFSYGAFAVIGCLFCACCVFNSPLRLPQKFGFSCCPTC